jgi:hypothetical protein
MRATKARLLKGRCMTLGCADDLGASSRDEGGEIHSAIACAGSGTESSTGGSWFADEVEPTRSLWRECQDVQNDLPVRPAPLRGVLREGGEETVWPILNLQFQSVQTGSGPRDHPGVIAPPTGAARLT